MRKTATRPPLAWRLHATAAALSLALGALALSAVAHAQPPEASPPEATPPEATPPGVKPHYVKCDPAHPEMPCTPDPVPPPGFAVEAEPGETPPPKARRATPKAGPRPDGTPPAQQKSSQAVQRKSPPRHTPKLDHPGRKPDYVKCDPNQPHMPCTPDRWEHPPAGVPGGPPAPGAEPDKGEPDPSGVKPHYVKCDPAHPELPCTPDVPPMLAPPN